MGLRISVGSDAAWLAPRELEVLINYAKTGGPAKVVAYEMGISEQTVKNHLSSTYSKFGFEGAGSLLLAFRSLGWLKVPEELQ